jgi:hypothetical protein
LWQVWMVKKSRVFGQSSRESHYQRGKLEITSGKQYSRYGRNIGCNQCHSLFSFACSLVSSLDRQFFFCLVLSCSRATEEE